MLEGLAVAASITAWGCVVAFAYGYDAAKRALLWREPPSPKPVPKDGDA